ncbi:MAG: prephenate dehydrogenase [Anaerolineae bacterium]|jgi:prephenate dehydrogenase
MKRLNEAQVTIVGLGLMGGSLAGALRGRCRTVLGVARRQETVEAALERGLIDEGTTHLAKGVRQADVVMLATPVRVILQLLEAIGPLLPPGCLLMDLGSTKALIVEAMAYLPDDVQPLGGHPMCGKETAGIEAAEPGLYEGATFILTPLPRTSEQALSLGRELAVAAGAHPLVLSAERQDFLVGTMSHLPYLMACALVGTADATTSADPAAWKIVAGGFRDTTRVAGSDVTMMTDILLTNREEVVKALDAFQEQIRRLARIVARGEEAELRTQLGKLRRTRLEMYA